MAKSPNINHILLVTTILCSLIAGTSSFDLSDSHKLASNTPSQLWTVYQLHPTLSAAN